MTDRELMKMALKFFDDIGDACGPYPYVNGTPIVSDSRKVSKALRDRLAQPEMIPITNGGVATLMPSSEFFGGQPEPEPVAWNGECILGHCGSPSGCDDSGCCRAAPPSIEAAVLAEREACAEICENIYQGDDITRDWLEDAAAAIRKRGEK